MSEELEGRSRRARKKVDYSIEQQFSDEDIFQDSDVEEKTQASSKRKSRGRKSTGILTTGVMESGMSFERAKPVYTERGYDPSLLPIRERFTFEPEYEDDGTPKIELIVGRRLIEDTKDRQYNEDEKESDDDDDESDAPRSSRSKSQSKNRKPSVDEDQEKANQTEMDYEYLLKYKGRSYLHLEWKSAADLESMGKVAKTIYRRFLKKLEQGTEEDLEDPTFDPSYTEPGRILAEEEHEIMVEMTNKELAKWQKEQAAEMGEEDESEEEEEENVPPAVEPDAAQEGKEEEKKEEEQPVGEFTWHSSIHWLYSIFTYSYIHLALLVNN